MFVFAAGVSGSLLALSVCICTCSWIPTLCRAICRCCCESIRGDEVRPLLRREDDFRRKSICCLMLFVPCCGCCPRGIRQTCG